MIITKGSDIPKPQFTAKFLQDLILKHTGQTIPLEGAEKFVVDLEIQVRTLEGCEEKLLK